MVNYRPGFENHSPWKSSSGARPSWDAAPPRSLRGIWPKETQSEGCRNLPRVCWCILHLELGQTAAHQRLLSASTDALQQQQTRPSCRNGFVQSRDGRSGNQSHLRIILFPFFFSPLGKVLLAKLAGENALMLDQQGDTSEQAGWGEWVTTHQGQISS